MWENTEYVWALGTVVVTLEKIEIEVVTVAFKLGNKRNWNREFQE